MLISHNFVINMWGNKTVVKGLRIFIRAFADCSILEESCQISQAIIAKYHTQMIVHWLVLLLAHYRPNMSPTLEWNKCLYILAGRLKNVVIGSLLSLPAAGSAIIPNSYPVCATWAGPATNGQVVTIPCQQPINARFVHYISYKTYIRSCKPPSQVTFSTN